MNRVIFLVILLTVTTSSLADNLTDKYFGLGLSTNIPSTGINLATCIDYPNVIRLCGGDHPTIWLNPDLEPRDSANRLLGAFEAMGYVIQRTAK